MNQDEYRKVAFFVQKLPPTVNIETVPVLKQLAQAHRYLAELKGGCRSIPNDAILVNTLALQEAKDSSEVENIVTTHDELFQQSLFEDGPGNPAAKEVQNYASALKLGFQLVRKSGILANSTIKKIQEELEGNQAGFRKQAGTALKNQNTGEVVYVPPQHPDEIDALMANLEAFIHDDALSSLDPLIKMAVIHFQFESVHPFYNGNGRTGRIMNVLYLVHKGLLDLPVLYLSRFITQDKKEYYDRLQAVRDGGEWEAWVIYMLKGVETTARQTLAIVEEINKMMMDYKHRIRKEFKFYSQDLLNNLFSHPYTKIDFLRRDLKVSRLTAAKYLDTLAEKGYLEKKRLGRSNYYINTPLFRLLSNVPEGV
ncbi:MAG: Fic family protein [Planctomycetota bacterium]